MKYIIISLFLILNLSATDRLENDNEYTQELEKFAKRYPYTARFVIGSDSLVFFNNNRYRLEKKIIDKSIKKTFIKKESLDKRNLAYIVMALEFIGSNFDEKELTGTIKKLKHRYSLNDIRYVANLWMKYRTKYNLLSNRKKKVASFFVAVDIYGVPLLKRYSSYADDFYPVLLPEKYDNHVYQKTMSVLMKSIKSSQIKERSYFLKSISLDIELALMQGSRQREITSYFKEFLKRDFSRNIAKLDCHQKQGVALIVSDNLDYKLDWFRHNPSDFYAIAKMLEEENNNQQIVNMLGLYNYASVIYSYMRTERQKKMFESLIVLPTNSMLFNLSLIYGLGNHTEYFAAIINQNNNMYEHSKYKEILYVSREGSTILDHFKDGNMNRFIKETDDLVSTPYANIHDLTGGEIADISVEVADYASYASMIIPGVGIGMQIGRALAKATIKGVIKQYAKQISKNIIKFPKSPSEAYKVYNMRYNIGYSKSKAINSVLNNGVKATKSLEKIAENISKSYSYIHGGDEVKKLCTQK